MWFRFRKILERPAWNPPCCVTLEISYDADPAFVPYDEEGSTGGVSEVDYTVVAVYGLLGQYGQPTAFQAAEIALRAETGLDDDIRDWCAEDFAQRESEQK